jgi:4-amino-4-deoxy-L-arabinose transferase-like glycosyltransferase
MKNNSFIQSLDWPRRDVAILLGFWLFSLIWNFDKAFHIDDTAHLEMARWIAQQPLRPLSGLLSWGNDFEPIYVTNQPPLYFYLMALIGTLFGWTEAAMHSVMAIFSLWAILVFYRLCRLRFKTHAVWLASLLALNPAFVLGQNSMVDIPLLAIWMQFFFVLLRPNQHGSHRLFWASVFCTLALLVKYTSLVLVPILMLHIVWQRRAAYLFFLVIPIGALGMWSIFNIYDFGKPHLVGRPVSPRSMQLYWNLSVYWIGVLGAITPFAGMIFYSKIQVAIHTWIKSFWWLLLLICWGSYSLLLICFVLEPQRLALNLVLMTAFLSTGIGLLLAALHTLWEKVIQHREQTLENLTLGYWLFAPALFLVIFTPFMATRHVLLSLPALLLLTYYIAYKHIGVVAGVAVSLSFAMSCLLGAADKWYAEIYRTQAIQIRNKFPNETIWFNGNFGWQWYATRSGMQHYSNRLDFRQPTEGDVLIETQSACCALPLNKSIKLELIEERIIERGDRVARFASIMPYASDRQAWGYSYAPIEKFTIWRVVSRD